MSDKSSSTKVLLVHNIPAPYRIPLFNKIDSFAEIDVTVLFCSKDHDNRNWAEKTDFRFKSAFIPGIKIETHNPTDVVYHINPHIITYMSKIEYDVLIIGGYAEFTTQAAYFFAKYQNKPVILWSEATVDTQSVLSKAISPITKHIIRNSDAIIVPGTTAKRFHQERGALTEKIFISSNVSPKKAKLTEEDPMDIVSHNTIPREYIAGKTVVLFVGQIIERKGVDCLIDSYNRIEDQIDDTLLVMVGEGNQKERFQQKCEKLNFDSYYFTGWISEKAKTAWYSTADVFVLPTLRDHAPLVIHEALRAGLPIITTDAAGSAVDMVTPQNGSIIKSGDVDELYQNLHRFCSNKEYRQRAGKISAQLASERFNLSRSAEGFRDALNYATK